MIGILIIAHGALGDSLIHCAAHVLGARPEHLEHLSVTVHDDPAVMLARARTLVRSLDQGDGVLILSDMYGATPCNIVCRLLEPGSVEGISGVNLPMLVRALTYRNEPLGTVIGKALSGGHEGILNINEEVCHAAPRCKDR